MLDVALNTVLLLVKLHVPFLEGNSVLVQRVVEFALEVPPLDGVECSDQPYSIELPLHVFYFAAFLVFRGVYPPDRLPKSEALENVVHDVFLTPPSVGYWLEVVHR